MCCITNVEGRHGSDPFLRLVDLKAPCLYFGLAAMVSPADLVTEVIQQLNLKTDVDNTRVAIQLEFFILSSL